MKLEMQNLNFYLTHSNVKEYYVQIYNEIFFDIASPVKRILRGNISFSVVTPTQILG